MLKKKVSPMIGKFSGAWSSGIGAGPSDPASSPRTPLDFDIQSPSLIPTLKGLKNHQPGGVGLGIVVEMEKMGDLTLVNKVAFGQSIIHPNPLPVLEETVVDGLENFTFVTCHGSNKSTKIYCDESRRWFDGRKNLRAAATFYIGSPRFEDFTQYPPPDFLNSCHLCRKKLHGKDIYMYRGETGFCSNECRYKQIMMNEGKKKY